MLIILICEAASFCHAQQMHLHHLYFSACLHIVKFAIICLTSGTSFVQIKHIFFCIFTNYMQQQIQYNNQTWTVHLRWLSALECLQDWINSKNKVKRNFSCSLFAQLPNQESLRTLDSIGRSGIMCQEIVREI